jgi:flagellar basal-body rod modification protein FlgD
MPGEINSIGTTTLGESQVTNGMSEAIDKDGFLRLLLTQLQNQDPLDPMDNAGFIQQMTQFSSLEQLISIREAVEASTDILEQATENSDQASPPED